MGTRSTYRVIEQWTDDKTGKIKNENLVLVYLQYDGYPTGHPIDTAEWLSTGLVVNGYSPGEEKLVFNGAGCLAAQLVGKYKTGTGGCYIQSLSSRSKSIEYVCYENGKRPKEIFRGSPADFVIKYHKEDVEA